MANYQALCRTNAFAAKDVDALRADVKDWDIEVHDSTEHPGKVLLLCTEEGGWPSYRWTSDDESADVDFTALLASHLADDQTAVLMEIGWEKMRYFVGTAIAVRADGETTHITLDDIYAQAAMDLGGEITTIGS